MAAEKCRHGHIDCARAIAPQSHRVRACARSTRTLGALTPPSCANILALASARVRRCLHARKRACTCIGVAVELPQSRSRHPYKRHPSPAAAGPYHSLAPQPCCCAALLQPVANMSRLLSCRPAQMAGVARWKSAGNFEAQLGLSYGRPNTHDMRAQPAISKPSLDSAMANPTHTTCEISRRFPSPAWTQQTQHQRYVSLCKKAAAQVPLAWMATHHDGAVFDAVKVSQVCQSLFVARHNLETVQLFLRQQPSQDAHSMPH
eukprot:364791-Chlamydomonas_euryale.AAC.10